MSILNNEKLLDRLASEYALGTLKGGARRRFESQLPHSLLLRRAVAEWQDRLTPMAQFAPRAQPSAQVWQNLVRELKLQQVGERRATPRNWKSSLAFWRGLGLVSTALATLLVAVLVTKQVGPAAPPPSYIAMLADDQSTPIAFVTGNPHQHRMTVKLVAHQNVANDKSLELWAVPKQGAPRSLGLLASDGSITLPLPDNATPQEFGLLAVSLEPKGGSPKADGPTGPIIFKGAWVQV